MLDRTDSFIYALVMVPALTELPPRQMGEARHQLDQCRAFSCPSWARTRTLLIQSQACTYAMLLGIGVVS